MKKILLTLAALTAFAFANAQDFKPTAGKVSLELNVASPFAAASPVSLPTYGFKGRYFLSDLLAVRVGFNWSSLDSTTPGTLTNNDKIENTSSNSTFSFVPGIEKHFEGTDRLSPYVGATLPITIGSSETVNITGASSAVNTTTTVTNANGFTSFGLSLISGADFYIAKSLFLGVEFGLSFISSGDRDEVTAVSNKGGAANPDDVTVEGGSSFSISPAANAQFRLGYWF